MCLRLLRQNTAAKDGVPAPRLDCVHRLLTQVVPSRDKHEVLTVKSQQAPFPETMLSGWMLDYMIQDIGNEPRPTAARAVTTAARPTGNDRTHARTIGPQATWMPPR